MKENIEHPGKKLKEIRVEAGLSQEDIASRMHVRRETIGRWEREEHIPQKICESRLDEILAYLQDLIKIKNKGFKIIHNDRLSKLHFLCIMFGLLYIRYIMGLL